MRVDVFVVRHGETAWNREGRIQGWGDSPLTARGRAQARAAAARLARERFQALHGSDLGRARETAAVVAAAVHLDPIVDAGLRERSYGVLEGKTWDDIARDHPDAAHRLVHDPSFVIPGGESLAQFRDRVLSTLDRVAASAGEGGVAIVTHGGVLGILYRTARGLALDAPRTYTTVNAAVNHFRWNAGRWELVHWGDGAHLARVGSVDDDEPVD